LLVADEHPVTGGQTNALATGRQDIEDVAACSHRSSALRLALRSCICQVAIPAGQQRPQALIAVCCRCCACHALHHTLLFHANAIISRV